MRWYVDLSTIGKESPTQRYCVDADQWQKALQQVRALRGDEGPLGNFSIELLDDGYRAIDPVTRTRFVVSRADDAAVVNTVPQPLDAAPGAVSKSANGAPPARASNRGRASERGRMRRPATSPVIPSDPVPPAATPKASPTVEASGSSRPLATESTPPRVSPSQMPVEPLVPARPMQAETAFERMTGGVAVPLPSEVPARADAPTQVLGAYAVMTRRSEDPTAASPLTYRELGIAVPPSTTLADAEAIARAKFTMVRNAIAGAPKGQFIQLAIFDYEYAGRPKDGPPILTLTFKDWRGSEPEIRFPKRDGVSAGPSSLPPAAFRANAAMPVTVIEPPSQALSSIATPATERSGESSILAKQMMSVESVIESPTRETKPTVTQPGDPYAAAPASDAPAQAATPVSTAPAEPAVAAAPVAQPKDKGMATLASAGNEVKRILPTPTPSELRREAAAMAGDDDLTVVKDSSPPPPPEPTTMVIDVVVPARKPSVAPPAPPTTVAATSSPAAPLSAAVPATISSPAGEPPVPPPAPPVSDPPPAPPVSAPPPAPPVSDPPPAPPVSAPPPAPPVSAPPPAPPVSAPPPAPPVSAPPPAPPVSAPPPAPPVSAPPPAGAAGSAPAHTLSDGTADWALAARKAGEQQRQESAPPSRGMLAPGVIVRAPKGSRKNGDELIADLFEACSDLGFVQDPLDGAEFVADLVMESIPSLIVLVSFFDINAREFAVVRQVVAKGDGESLQPAILSRASEFTPNVARTMRSGRAVVFSASECAELAKDPRWNALGIVPQTMVAAPVVFNGRFLGILEVCNPVDGKKLSESDGHALTYIGEQFGEFLAQRDLSVEPDYVKRPKLAQLARR